MVHFLEKQRRKAVLILPETRTKKKDPKRIFLQGYQARMIAHSLNPWTTKMFEGVLPIQFHSPSRPVFHLGSDRHADPEAEVLSRGT